MGSRELVLVYENNYMRKLRKHGSAHASTIAARKLWQHCRNQHGAVVRTTR